MSSATYHYRSFFETLLSFDKTAANTFLKTANFAKDESSSITQVKTVTDDKTSGYLKRRALVKNGKVFNFVTSLHLDFFRTSKLIAAGIGFKLKFVKNNDDFIILSEDEKEYKVEILDLKISIQRVSISSSLYTKHISNFERGQNAYYPFRQSKFSSFLLPKGISSHHIPSIANGILPQTLYIGFVQSQAFSGKKDLNGYHFQNLSLNHIQFCVNGTSMPGTAYTPDFTKNQYSRSYQSKFL